MQPHALSLGAHNTSRGQSIVETGEKLRLEKSFCGSNRVRGIDNNDIVLLGCALFTKVASSVVKHKSKSRIIEVGRQSCGVKVLAHIHHSAVNLTHVDGLDA
jgi:hypothetical protein